MKWLYRILRLFFCPHKWVEKDTKPIRKSYTQSVIGISSIKVCKYCGKEKHFQHMLEEDF